MDVVALISGGKDSFFSLMHCQKLGHNVVALANLHPPTNNSYNNNAGPNAGAIDDELNSYMYQTVGYNVLPHYSTILGIPLYRASIKGSSLNKQLSYYPSHGEDETEDLYKLLLKIVQKHPNIKAVSSGAILSTYQRTRVESVCQRLGLTSLAYLWQRSQSRLLSEMADTGLDAKIIKVASMGLDDKWLGLNVTDPKTREQLEHVKRNWGGNVAGEGGEFETLVVGCNAWPGKIVFEETKVVKEGGGVSRLRVLKSRVDNNAPQHISVRIPDLLDGDLLRVHRQVQNFKYQSTNENSEQVSPAPRIPYSARFGNTAILANLTSSYSNANVEDEPKGNIDVPRIST